MSETPEIIYVTTYALSGGIKTFSLDHVAAGGAAIVHTPNPRLFREVFHGNEWHSTPSAAIARAEDMRVAKIASLRKQIAKLEALSFDVVDQGGEGTWK